MTRHGEPIEDAFLKGGVSTGIRFSMRFEGWEAAVAARLDMERWEAGGYDRQFMANVIAWHRLHELVEQHSRAAVAGKSK